MSYKIYIRDIFFSQHCHTKEISKTTNLIHTRIMYVCTHNVRCTHARSLEGCFSRNIHILSQIIKWSMSFHSKLINLYIGLDWHFGRHWKRPKMGRFSLQAFDIFNFQRIFSRCTHSVLSENVTIECSHSERQETVEIVTLLELFHTL